MPRYRLLAALSASLTLAATIAVTTAEPRTAAGTGRQQDTIAAIASTRTTGTLGRAARPGTHVTREQVIRRAQAWVEKKVRYSQSEWHTDQATGGPWRQDCSGFISMAWQLPASETTLTLPRHARPIDVRTLQPGDLLNSSSHALLFHRWTDKAKGRFTYYQESNPRVPTNLSRGNINAPTLAGHPTSSYRAYRYNNIRDNDTANPPTPTPAATGSPSPTTLRTKPRPQPAKTTKPAPSTRTPQSKTVALAHITTARGRLYALAKDRSGVWQWTGKGDRWVKVGGPARQVYGGSAGLFATNPRSGDLYRFDPGGRRWARVGGPGLTFAAAGGRLYGLSPDRSGVWQWTGKGDRWVKVGGPARQVYGGSAGLF
ncbi:hypothetical protein ACIGO6_39955, partial [Streptomyces sp. NPDC053750]